MSHAIPVSVAIVRLKWELHWKPALRYTAWRWWRRLAVYERRVWECWKLSADEKLRARFADGLASPDGAAPSPAQGAAPLHAHTPRHAATRPRQPWDTAQQPVLREPPGLTDAPPDEPEGDPLALWRPYVPYRETWEQWGVATVKIYDCCDHCLRDDYERGEYCEGGLYLHEAPCSEGCNDGEVS